MSRKVRLTAAAMYIFILGWVYAAFTEKDAPLVRFHFRQSVGLLLVLLLVTGGWYGITWLLAWIPYAGILTGVIAFALVIAAWGAGILFWILGIVRALQGRYAALPLIGQWAHRLPF
ncbi:MAG: hypothetical protein WHX52_09080 [Anaerolineae bacterium]